MNNTRTVSEWVASLRWEDIPEEVIVQAKRCIRDHIGCAVGGAQSRPGKIASEMAESWGGSEESTIICSSQLVNARNAAFANATMANALDFDDTLHGHPGATTIPPALAIAEKENLGGKDLLIAIIIGYELTVRTMALLQPIVPRYVAMWDLGTLQTYGAAAAVGRLLAFSPEKVANTLGIISGTTKVPLPRKKRIADEGRSMLKSAYGWSTDAAIVAGEMTQAGFEGPTRALDDNMAFWKVMPSERWGWDDFTTRLGEQWAIMEVAFKPYMACRFLHPVLQGVETLLKEKPIPFQNITQIDIRSFSLLTDEHHFILNPTSETDAQFSVPYTVAAMLYAADTLTPKSYSEKWLTDPRLLDLAKKIKIDIDPVYDSAYPQKLGAYIRITQNDQSIREINIDDPLGTPDQPISDSGLRGKFYSLANPLFKHEQTKNIDKMIDNIDTINHVREFTRLLRPDLETLGS